MPKRQIIRRMLHPRNLMWMVGMWVGIVGCKGGDSLTIREYDHDTLWDLRLNHRTVVMSMVAPYDTLQLTYVARGFDKRVLTGLPAATFTSSGKQIEVSETGLVRAKGTVTNGSVIARLQYGSITAVDTVFIQVTNVAAPRVLRTFSIQPLPGDSTKIPLGLSDAKKLTVTILDTANTAIPSVPVRYESTGAGTIQVDATGKVMGVRVGTEMVYAYTTFYGVSKRDSVLFAITENRRGNFTVKRQVLSNGDTVLVWNPAELVLPVPAIVRWWSKDADSIDVVFEKPEFAMAAPNTPTKSGNIPLFKDPVFTGPAELRQFNVPGVYKFKSTRYPISGTLIVK